MSVCVKLLIKCRNCKLTFDKDYEGESCPSCGESRRCKSKPLAGYNHCAYHGGPKLGRGKAALKGTSSRFQLVQLASKYAEMQRDGLLLTVKPAIFTVRQRVLDLLGRIEENYNPDRIKNIQILWENFKNAADVGEETMYGLLLDQEFEKEMHDYRSWEQIFKALDLERKLAVDEMKILREMQAYMTYEQGYELTAQILAIIMRVIDDPAKIKQIQFEFIQLVGDGLIADVGGERGEVVDVRPSGVDKQELLDT